MTKILGILDIVHMLKYASNRGEAWLAANSRLPAELAAEQILFIFFKGRSHSSIADI